MRAAIGNKASAGGTGNVTGPASATANAIVIFSDGTGKVIGNSVVTVDGSGNITGLAQITGSALTITGTNIYFNGLSQDGDCNQFIGVDSAGSLFYLSVALAQTLLGISDAGLKTNIRAYAGGLAAIRKLRAVTFNHKTSRHGYNPQVEQLGFLAQNVKEADPRAVTALKDGTLSVSDRAVLAMVVTALQEMAPPAAPGLIRRLWSKIF